MFVTKSPECFSSTLQLVLPRVYAALSTQQWSSLLHKTKPQSHIGQLMITEEQVCGRIKQSI
jgi:hypothetical protein